MGAALLALHRSTGERKWLGPRSPTGDFIAATFVDPKTGGFLVSASPDARHLPKPIKQREDNVTATRFFTLLAFYSGNSRYREIAEAGMGYLASPAVLEASAFLPDVLLAEEELRNEPVHVTVVGAKDDPRSAALYAGALAYPLAYKRAEWWDRREGKLTNPDVDYPDFPDGPAAFACTRNFCSLPVTDARRSRRTRPAAARHEIIGRMIEKQEVQELFPTPLWIVDLKPAEAAALNAKLKAEIERLIPPRPKVPAGSNWQTPQDLHKRPAFAEFVKLVETAAAASRASCRSTSIRW